MPDEIKLSGQMKKQLATEFKVSTQTIRMSLKYVFNRKRNIEIRQRAVEILRKEANKHSIKTIA